MKWVRQRCQLAPANTAAMAFFSPLLSQGQALVGIGGYQLHPAEPPSGQRPQEGQPERTVLAGAHVHTQDLTLPFGIDPRRHHHADVDDAAALTHLLGQAVQPHVGVGAAVQGPTQETLHHFVQLLADARHLAAGDAVATQSLDQVIHPPGGHAFYIGLLDDGQPGLLAAPPRFQQAGEVAAFPQLGNVQLHGADPGAGAVAVAVGDPPGLRSPCSAPIWAETSASMMPSTRTRRASRRKSTSPSIPRLRNNSKRSMLCLTTVVLLVLGCDFRSRMTRWLALGYTDSFTPPPGTLLGYPSSTLLRVLGFSPRHTEAANLPDLTQVSGNVSEILVLPTPVRDQSIPPLPQISVVHERSGPRRSAASCLSWLNPRPCLINVEIFSLVNFDNPLHSHHQGLPQYGQGSLTGIDH